MRNAYFSMFLALILCCAVNGQTGDRHARPDYGLLLHPGEAGHNEEEVVALTEKAKNARINTIILLVKDPAGLYYSSKLFPNAVAPGYKNFDLLSAVIIAAHKRGMRVEAWLADFVEGKNSWAYTNHPEWAELNADGETTLSEIGADGRSYQDVWMCPARRPGYVDQYLLPIVREIVRNYPVDGIRHGFARYPGDINPDGYCFCDYCLKHVFAHSHLVYDSEPHIVPLVRFLPRIDADLAREYTPKPPHWDEWTRREKATFFLHGRYEYDSSPDMSYFFYTYRTDVVKDFMHEAHEIVKDIRPEVAISAAVFKNPLAGGRFLGQKWSDWTDFVDEFMPMTFRNQFNGSWSSFLQEFGEYTRYQKRWVANRKLNQSIFIPALYQEMIDSIHHMASASEQWLALGGAGGTQRSEILRWSQVTLAQLPEGPRKSELKAAVQNLPKEIDSETDRAKISGFRHVNEKLLSNPPEGFFPPSRLLEAIHVARENSADGIILYGVSTVEDAGLWETVREGYNDDNRGRLATGSAPNR